MQAAIIHVHNRHLLLLLSPNAGTHFAGNLSRPRHCSKGAKPVPKAVYHSDCARSKIRSYDL